MKIRSFTLLDLSHIHGFCVLFNLTVSFLPIVDSDIYIKSKTQNRIKRCVWCVFIKSYSKLIICMNYSTNDGDNQIKWRFQEKNWLSPFPFCWEVVIFFVFSVTSICTIYENQYKQYQRRKKRNHRPYSQKIYR